MSNLSPNKELNQLVAVAERQGWHVEKTKKNHLKWVSPTGQLVFSPSTPSSPRNLRNTIRDLKAYGFIEIKRNQRSKPSR